MITTRFRSRSVYFSFSVASLLLFSIATVFDGGLNDDILKYTNQFRKSKRLPALEMSEELNAIARRHSEDMAKGKCGFGHSGYHQRELQVQRTMKMEYGMAENVAYGATSAKQVVAMWKGSSGHRKNMLGNYKYIGIGTARDKHGAIYYTQIFVR
jgi:uncharacterized protein YkwD